MTAGGWPFTMCNRCPVLAVPSGIGATGVSTGMQIVGRTYADAEVFQVGRALERERPWLDVPARRPSLPQVELSKAPMQCSCGYAD